MGQYIEGYEGDDETPTDPEATEADIDMMLSIVDALVEANVPLDDAVDAVVGLLDK